MAPIKLEDNIKEQFANREIKPSIQAWDSLERRLDTAPKKKNKFGIFWLVAASVIGLVLIGALLFVDGPDRSQDTLVESAPNNQEIQDKSNLEPVIESNEQIADQQSITLPKKDVQVKQNSSVNQTNTTATQTIAQQEAPVVLEAKNVITTNALQQELANQKDVATTTEVTVNSVETDPIAIKVSEVVDAIAALEKNNKTVTEAELDALLDAAQKELMATQLVDPITQKVDADALLLDVEFELERSFRDKVFDALGDGYNKIRTAMAERNN